MPIVSAHFVPHTAATVTVGDATDCRIRHPRPTRGRSSRCRRRTYSRECTDCCSCIARTPPDTPTTLLDRQHKQASMQHTHTHTQHIRGIGGVSQIPRVSVTLFSRTTWVCRYQKGKTNLEQETVNGSGISWAICKSAPRSIQITAPAPPPLFFTGRIPFLPPNQQRQSTEGTSKYASNEVIK